MSTVTETRSTTLPTYDDDAPPPIPRASVGTSTVSDRFDRYGALFGSLALTWLLCERVLPLPGVAWFLVVWFVTAIALTTLVTLLTGSMTAPVNRAVGHHAWARFENGRVVGLSSKPPL